MFAVGRFSVCLALAALLAACESATGSLPGTPSVGDGQPTSPAADGALSGPVVSGDPATLEGSWVEIRTEPASGGGTVTSTQTLTFSGDAYSAQQVNSYSDDRPNDTFSQTGTATFQSSDGTVTIHETSEIYKGNGPNAIDRTSTWRNLVIDGVWHPSVFKRKGGNQGIGGVWESPKNGTTKVQITFTPNGGRVNVVAFALDAQDAVTGPPVSTAQGSYTWDGSTLTMNFPNQDPTSQSCVLLTNDLLEMPFGASTRAPVLKRK